MDRRNIVNTEKAKQENDARHIIHVFHKTKSEWLKVEMLRNLALYVDFHFVKCELRDIYIAPASSEKIKKTIIEIHDGTIDLSDLRKAAEENKKIFDEIDRLREEVEIEDYMMKASDDNTSPPYSNSELMILRYQSNKKVS
jgi:hypothetical protein